MFAKILIANRGEIACRIIRTAHRMGIATVAVYSDADAGAPHVEMAGEAVHIGPSPAAESYLDGSRIIEAALSTGAKAIHPGYGFLSENPDFAEQVVAAGLVFIGPSPAAIRAMGLKDMAKRLMEKAGVPVVPGYHGDGQEIVILAAKAREIGYPVLIKARAGGGGKGMRRVNHPDEFAETLASAKREAKATFRDDRVLVEKYIERPRHIEVQVFGDNSGNVVHLYERDCSAQRRHQKVIEEAPAPGMTEAMRAAMTGAALKAAKAIGYSGAGTVEFIADASDGLRADRFWFMEMNTRLQVEHPVTELVTGIDLVEWQLRVAAGESLPRSQHEIELDGHAFEARIYAEDPARGFLPAAGTLHHLKFPAETPCLRVESGVRAGDTISPHYDPMIAKLAVQGKSRAVALDALCSALAATEIAGSTVNIAFLAAVANDPDFTAGRADTGLIGRKQAQLTRATLPDTAVIARAAVAASGISDTPRCADPWVTLAGYTHFTPLTQKVHLRHGGESVTVALTIRNREIDADVGGETVTVSKPGRFARWPGHVTLFEGAKSYDFDVPHPLESAASATDGIGSLRAPMPGLVKLVRAAAGEHVSKGQPLLVLEAMKMEHVIAAPQTGTIAEIAAEGAQVSDGTILARFAGEN